MSSSMELSPWHRVASFLLAVAWQFRSANILSSSIVNSAHLVSAGFAVSKILLIFWVTQGPAEPPFMYERTCQGASETRNMLHPSTCRAPTYLQNGHSRG